MADSALLRCMFEIYHNNKSEDKKSLFVEATWLKTTMSWEDSLSHVCFPIYDGMLIKLMVINL